jgi:uncharacterized protein (DUF1330 family)
MSVILIVQGNHDPQHANELVEYQKVARAMIEKHGGQVIARGKGVGKLAGTRQFGTGIVVRFPDRAAADAWYADPAYQAVIPLRSKGYADLEIGIYEE